MIFVYQTNAWFIQYREKGIITLRLYQYWIFISSSYRDLNLFWDAKILRTREIRTLCKLYIIQFLRSFWSLVIWSPNFSLLLKSKNRGPWVHSMFLDILIAAQLQKYLLLQKRFYTRGTLRGISILRLDEIATLYRDWLISLN